MARVHRGVSVVGEWRLYGRRLGSVLVGWVVFDWVAPQNTTCWRALLTLNLESTDKFWCGMAARGVGAEVQRKSGPQWRVFVGACSGH